MNKEFAAGAVVFRRDPNGMPLFLLVYSSRNKNWGFPKGHLEPGESEHDAALREIVEETGITDVRFVEGFRQEDIYPAVSNRPPLAGCTIEKHSVYFLAETASAAVSPDLEEIGECRWLAAAEAERLLEFEGIRRIFRSAVTLVSSCC